MYILQIEHPVKSFDEWKKVFDSDPLKRKESGVRRHRLMRLADNTNHVVGDLEFESKVKAQEFLTRLQALWPSLTGKVIENPHGRIFEMAESKEY